MISRVVNLIKRLIKRREGDEKLTEVMYAEYDGPQFSVGDPVIVINPYVPLDEMDQPPRHTMIENIAYISNLDAYAYKVTGSTQWYNEAWLMYDEYGPATYHVAQETNLINEAEKERKANLDYWLMSYKFEKERGNEAEAEKALKELRKLKGN